jgi:DNA-binding transcriptional MocR family regulator
MVDLERGQLCTGRHRLAGELGMSEQTIRTALEHLHNLEMITSEPTNKFTIYSIVNYNSYQDQQPTINQPTTNEQPTSNQPTTTIQEHKHINTKEEIHIVPSKLVDTCPHEKIIELYHSTLPTMPSVKVWTEKRRKLLQARWREDQKRQDLDYWERFFGYVAKSDFLCGRTEKPFNCDLEWMLNASNFVKIIEGKYHAGL